MACTLISTFIIKHFSLVKKIIINLHGECFIKYYFFKLQNIIFGHRVRSICYMQNENPDLFKYSLNDC